MPILKQSRLETDTFLLRPWTFEDAAMLNATLLESRDFLLPWMSWIKDVPSLQDTRASIEKNIKGWEDETDFTIGVFDARDGTTALGSTGFHRLSERIAPDDAQVGMWIAGERAHKGLGTEVLKAMLAWGFRDWGFEKLQWRCDPDNLASIRCALKGGMEDQGVWEQQTLPNGDTRDSRVFWLTRESFLARAAPLPHLHCKLT
jgi:RimJ/RimL family protein N-acetyltransferase